MAFELSMVRGNDRIARIALLDVDGEPFAWDDTKAWFTAKLAVSDADADAVFRKSTDAGEGITVPEAGVAVVVIARADTDGLPNVETALECEVQVRLPNGDIVTVDQGRIVVKPRVTVGAA